MQINTQQDQDTHNFVHAPIAFDGMRMVLDGNSDGQGFVDNSVMRDLFAGHSKRIESVQKRYDENMYIKAHSAMDLWKERMHFSASMAGAFAEVAALERLRADATTPDNEITHILQGEFPAVLSEKGVESKGRAQQFAFRSNAMGDIEQRWQGLPIWNVLKKAQRFPSPLQLETVAKQREILESRQGDAFITELRKWPESFDGFYERLENATAKMDAIKGLDKDNMPVDPMRQPEFLDRYEVALDGAQSATATLEAMQQSLEELEQAVDDALADKSIIDRKSEGYSSQDMHDQSLKAKASGYGASLTRTALITSKLFCMQALQHFALIRPEIDARAQETAALEERWQAWCDEAFGAEELDREAMQTGMILDNQYISDLSADEMRWIDDNSAFCRGVNNVLADDVRDINEASFHELSDLQKYSCAAAAALVAYVIHAEFEAYKIERDTTYSAPDGVIAARRGSDNRALCKLIDALPASTLALRKAYDATEPYAQMLVPMNGSDDHEIVSAYNRMEVGFREVKGAISDLDGFIAQQEASVAAGQTNDSIRNIIAKSKMENLGKHAKEHAVKLEADSDIVFTHAGDLVGAVQKLAMHQNDLSPDAQIALSLAQRMCAQSDICEAKLNGKMHMLDNEVSVAFHFAETDIGKDDQNQLGRG